MYLKKKMYNVVLSKNFKKDLKLAKKNNYNLDLLDNVVEKIASGKKLEEKYKDHALKGDFIGFRECHIQPDWLLIYQYNDDELLLLLTNMGSHSDLFNK